MSKGCFLILLLAILTCILYADGYPTSSFLDKVYIIMKDGTGVEGYADLINYSYDHRPAVKSAPKGSDILPLVLENYTEAESLRVDTVIVSYGGNNFGLQSGKRKFNITDIKSILAVEEILPESTTRKEVNFEAYLTDAEYKQLLQGYTASLSSFGYDIGSICILSCNPKFTQLDLYLYCCMMDKGMGESIHPFLDSKSREAFVRDLEDFYFNKNTRKSVVIINTLKKCQTSWRTMASYLKDSQAILPSERENAIAKLDSLVSDCDTAIRIVSDLVKSKNFPTREEDVYKLDISICRGIFPNLYFPCKDGDRFDWSGYLLKRGIILKYLAWD